MTAPVLLTDRLRLDGHRVDDLDGLATMWTDPAVYARIGDGRPREREEVWRRLLGAAGQWALFGYGAWLLRDRRGGAVLGQIGLMEARRAIEPPLDAPEMGWVLAPAAQGRGLAREALAAILAWADAGTIGRTTCIIDPDNAGSLRLATRLGYRPLGSRAYHGRPVEVFERRRAAA